MIQLGEKVAEIRKSREVSQKRLAELVGIKVTTLSGYENNYRRMPEHIFVRCCKELGIDALDVYQIKSKNPKDMSVNELVETLISYYWQMGLIKEPILFDDDMELIAYSLEKHIQALMEIIEKKNGHR